MVGAAGLSPSSKMGGTGGTAGLAADFLLGFAAEDESAADLAADFAPFLSGFFDDELSGFIMAFQGDTDGIGVRN
jgi:hypothetical protein